MIINQQELNKMCLEAQENMESIGIKFPNSPLSFKIDGRCSGCCARCTTRIRTATKEIVSQQIKFNPKFLDATSVHSLWDVIYHELCHAASPFDNDHGKEWQELADRCNKAFNVNVSQYYDDPDNSYTQENYCVECVNCNRRYNKSVRRTKVYIDIASNIQNYRCPHCDGKVFKAIDLRLE